VLAHRFAIASVRCVCAFSLVEVAAAVGGTAGSERQAEAGRQAAGGVGH
jgi:hypothetical protein